MAVSSKPTNLIRVVYAAGGMSCMEFDRQDVADSAFGAYSITNGPLGALYVMQGVRHEDDTVVVVNEWCAFAGRKL